MESSTSLLERKEIWALIGTALGFALNLISRTLGALIQRRRLRAALRDELDTNLYQLSQKINTFDNILRALEKRGLLPGTTVPSASAVYSTNLTSIIHLLKPLERDNVQNIYARLKIQDDFLHAFEDKFRAALKDAAIDDPWKAYTSMLTNLREDCEVTQELIKSFLANKPVDMYGRKTGKPPQQDQFAGKVTPEVIRQQRSK